MPFLDLVALVVCLGLGDAPSLPVRQTTPLPVFADFRHDFQHDPVLCHPQKPRNGLESAPALSRNSGPEDGPGPLFFLPLILVFIMHF